MKRCRYCHRQLWTTIFGPCCEYCDRMDLWPNTAGDVTILGPTNPRRSELQAECDDIIRGTVYDWEREGDAQ